MNYLQNLQTDGVVVIPALTGFNLWQAHTELKQGLYNFNEVVDHKNYAQKPALAIFGALGTASSFHHPAVRNIRILAFEAIRQHFKQYYNLNGTQLKNIQLLIDRVGVRVPHTQQWGGGNISGESWHRDQAPQQFMKSILPDGKTVNSSGIDEVLGGWINLNMAVTQAFVCVKGTHLQRSNESGFVTDFTKEDKKKFDQNKVTIEVPPGHIILFYQNIIHMVRKYTIGNFEYRLFLGIRFTNDINSIFDYNSALVEQGVPVIPSGQTPRLYEKMHAINHKDKIGTWTTYFIPEMQHTKGKTPLPPVSKSLYLLSQESGKNLMYPKYQDYELALFIPTPLNWANN